MAERELKDVVQRVTEESTALAGAQFGAFFYNVLDARGESYMLSTIAGVPRSAFERFPMPRNTAVFDPTSRVRELLAGDAGATADGLATRLDDLAASFSRLRRRDDLALLIARVNP